MKPPQKAAPQKRRHFRFPLNLVREWFGETQRQPKRSQVARWLRDASKSLHARMKSLSSLALKMDLRFRPFRGFRVSFGFRRQLFRVRWRSLQSISFIQASKTVSASWLRARGARGHRAKARQASGPFFQLSSAQHLGGSWPVGLETSGKGPCRGWRTATEGLLLRFFCGSPPALLRARATKRSTARQARHDSGALHCLVNDSARMRAGCMLDMQGSRWSVYPAVSVYPECSRRCERSCCRFARGSHRLRSLQASMLPSCGGDDAVKSSLVAPSSARREMLRALAAPEAGGSSETRLGRRHLALCGCRQLSA